MFEERDYKKDVREIRKELTKCFAKNGWNKVHLKVSTNYIIDYYFSDSEFDVVEAVRVWETDMLADGYDEHLKSSDFEEEEE